MEVGINPGFLHFNEGVVPLVIYCSILKLIMAIMWKKLSSKGIKSVLKKWT